jgi:L-alanine-DL-glutamate epimerase-like enolase superfamily enzyme
MRNNSGKENRSSAMQRRDFLRLLTGAAALVGVKGPFDYARAAITPGEKGIYITNMYRTKLSGMGGIIIRLETNKGITGYGECRDLDSGAQSMLSSLGPYIVGMNPTQVDKIYNTMLSHYTPATIMANQELNGTGAISGIEMACWDIIGKVYNVPLYKLLGTKYRDKIRMYADTDNNRESDINARIAKGFTWFKSDMYLSSIAMGNYSTDFTANSYGYRPITIDSTGLERMQEYLQTYRDTLVAAGEPYASAPIGSDHYQGYNNSTSGLSVESAIALADALKGIAMGGAIEDVIDWYWNDENGVPVIKQVTDATDAMVMTGEDMFGYDQFKAYADVGAVNFIHPEPNTAGGIHQTLLAAKYAYSKGMTSLFHNSSGPIAMTSYAHLAACTPGFQALEYHHMGISWHDDVVDGINKPMINNGYMDVPEGPGLGVSLNATVLSAHGARTWTKVV